MKQFLRTGIQDKGFILYSKHKRYVDGISNKYRISLRNGEYFPLVLLRMCGSRASWEWFLTCSISIVSLLRQKNISVFAAGFTKTYMAVENKSKPYMINLGKEVTKQAEEIKNYIEGIRSFKYLKYSEYCNTLVMNRLNAYIYGRLRSRSEVSQTKVDTRNHASSSWGRFSTFLFANICISKSRLRKEIKKQAEESKNYVGGIGNFKFFEYSNFCNALVMNQLNTCIYSRSRDGIEIRREVYQTKAETRSSTSRGRFSTGFVDVISRIKSRTVPTTSFTKSSTKLRTVPSVTIGFTETYMAVDNKLRLYRKVLRKELRKQTEGNKNYVGGTGSFKFFKYSNICNALVMNQLNTCIYSRSRSVIEIGSVVYQTKAETRNKKTHILNRETAYNLIRNTENITSAKFSFPALFVPKRPHEKSEVTFQLFLNMKKAVERLVQKNHQPALCHREIHLQKLGIKDYSRVYGDSPNMIQAIPCNNKKSSPREESIIDYKNETAYRQNTGHTLNALDIDNIASKVYLEIEQKIKRERERRGI